MIQKQLLSSFDAFEVIDFNKVYKYFLNLSLIQ
jgi:hypothetical protein